MQFVVWMPMLRNLDTPDLLLQDRKREVTSRDPLSPSRHFRRLRRAVEPAFVDNRVLAVQDVPVTSGDEEQPSCHDLSECDEVRVADISFLSECIAERDAAPLRQDPSPN